MPTIKISKSQWEFIGQKTGWIKTSQNARQPINILEALKEGIFKRFPKIGDKLFNFLQKLPSFEGALKDVDQIVNRMVDPAKFGINQGSSENALNKVVSIVDQNNVGQASSNNALFKIAWEQEPWDVRWTRRFIAGIIIALIGWGVVASVNSMKNLGGEIGPSNQQHYENIEKNINK